MKYLLDTNICIGIINGRPEKVRSNAAAAIKRNASFTTSSIVAHELWYGVEKSRQVDRNRRASLGFLSRDIEVLEFKEQDAQAAGKIRADLEFERVKGLVVEDWTG